MRLVAWLVVGFGGVWAYVVNMSGSPFVGDKWFWVLPRVCQDLPPGRIPCAKFRPTSTNPVLYGGRYLTLCVLGGWWLAANCDTQLLTLVGFLPVAAVSRPLPPPPLGHPKPALVPSVPDSPTSWPRMPRPKTILFPELAGLLVHPDVDSYSDAPKVPGQPDLSVSPPPFLEYIHCVGEALPLTGLRGCESTKHAHNWPFLLCYLYFHYDCSFSSSCMYEDSVSMSYICS